MIAFLLALILNAGAEPSLRVRALVVTPPGSAVTLRQLVEDPEQLGDLGATVVSRGLAAGKSERLSSARLMTFLRPVLARARATGVNVHVVRPETVTLEASGGELIAADVMSELLRGWQMQCAGCRLAIESLNLPQILNVRAWSIKTLPTLPRGTFSVPLTLTRDQGAPTTGWVGGRLKVERLVPVARRLLGTGERLTESDLAWEYRDTAQAIDGIPDRTELSGRALRRGIALNDVIWQGALERERAVTRGETLTLRASEKDWEVTLNVVAPRDGYKGDVMTFKNLKTNNQVVGRITGPGQAEMQ